MFMKNKNLLLIILVMVLIVSIGKETYALFTNEVSSIVQSYSTGTLKLSYSNVSINLDNAYPLMDKEGMSQDVNTITITNIGTLAYKFNVILDPSSDSTISSDLIRVSLDGEKPATLSSDGNIIIRDVVLNPGSSRTFTIKLWINSSASSTDILNKKFSASLTSTGIAVKNVEDSNGIVLAGVTGPLYDYIKRKADTTTTIDFSQSFDESNTNGIYMTADTDSGMQVYYYRGNVDNHLIFANYCWRIVRTTETGGVKLIYDGAPSNGQCNNTGIAATIGNSNFNYYSDSPADVGYMYGTRYTHTSKTMLSLSGSMVFGNDVTYANGIYTLIDTYTLTDASNWKSEYTTIASKYHYTCFTSSDTCEKVDYVFDTRSSDSYYFELSDGKNHLDILKEMLDNSTNENDSTIKTTVDTWYKANMIDYTSQLEDTVFCNDRSYDVKKTIFDKDYSTSVNDTSLNFNSSQRAGSYKPTLVCININDKFTVEKNNGNGALDYPVGLLTFDEVMYAGMADFTSDSSFYLDNEYSQWSLSPYVFNTLGASGEALYSETDAGSIFTALDISGSDEIDVGVRPVVSLKPGIEITGGSGTATDPYIVLN
mgnify:CR=1 FL=1